MTIRVKDLVNEIFHGEQEFIDPAMHLENHQGGFGHEWKNIQVSAHSAESSELVEIELRRYGQAREVDGMLSYMVAHGYHLISVVRMGRERRLRCRSRAFWWIKGDQ